jgi:hypothetical protein
VLGGRLFFTLGGGVLLAVAREDVEWREDMVLCGAGGWVLVDEYW